mgnify:CR=1 FL=1|tara:strand:+ start:1413 stop:2429 length:1017 start_codon:yes stop_codon:yes gene_type:complete
MKKHFDKPKVTLTEVAERAGVSKMTVSKVLRNTGSISTNTRDKILKAVDDLGYVKNSIAGLLSSQKSSMVAVIIPSASDTVFAEILSGINSVIRPQNFNTLIGETLFDPKIEYETLSTILSLQPAGLIISSGINRSKETIDLLNNRRCPLITLWDKNDTIGEMNIGLSHFDAGQLMAIHFLERGKKNIAYIGSELDIDLCAKLRFEGFRNKVLSAGLELAVESCEDLPRQSETGEVLTRNLIEKHPDTDAIFYLNDSMALGGLSWLYESGISVPDKISAAGFNGTSIGQTVMTKLTTLNVARRAIGEAAANAILDIINERDVVFNGDVEVTFVQGTTT